MRVTVIGAGVAGLACGVALAEKGASVEIIERSLQLGQSAAAWQAGGMLAPWCESQNAEPLVAQLGEESIEWWASRCPDVVRNGTLVVAHARDTAELERFARRAERYTWVQGDQIGVLEPQLSGRFSRGLLFQAEAHLDPRAALRALAQRLEHLGGRIRFGVDGSRVGALADRVVDCRGLAARDVLADLRAVRGEMVLLRALGVVLTRPVRVLHPRVPLYIVPRGDGLFMLGATMIESDAQRNISARSLLELLSAAYAVHPAFGEAEVVEIGVGLRPAFPDNLPRIRQRDGVVYVNGLYRHGFLLAPALARMTADVVLRQGFYPEVMDEDSRQRRPA
ncbi:MAG: glycine oxidase ThiO [Steroidobacteraceae bacterium]|jgi:glycine oxidase|nr:glycine oxidase ThiO [Steroidobacteraceae bacterium]